MSFLEHKGVFMMGGSVVPEGEKRSLGLHPAVLTHTHRLSETRSKAAQLALAETFCTKQSKRKEKRDKGNEM